MADLFATLAQLRTEWPSTSWSWDGRLPTATSAITADKIDEARCAVARALPHPLDGATLAQAPAGVRELIERSGGLRDQQLAYYSDGDGIVAVGLWWPWGGGKNVSLRIGLVDANKDAGLVQRLRATFGIEG
jgi:hypothetical protein